MGIVKTSKTAEYSGKVCEAKDNMTIETRTGKNSVALYAPVDFVDKMLGDFTGQEIEVSITIEIKVK